MARVGLQTLSGRLDGSIGQRQRGAGRAGLRTLRATTDLDLMVLDRVVFLDAVCGYTVSAEAAEAVVARHLATFRPVWASA